MQKRRIKKQIWAFLKVQKHRYLTLDSVKPLYTAWNVGVLQKPMQTTNKAVETTNHDFLSRKRAMWTYHLT